MQTQTETADICFTSACDGAGGACADPEWCLGSAVCRVKLLQHSDLAPKVMCSKMERPLQRLQLAPKKPGWRNGWNFGGPNFGYFLLWQEAEHTGVCKAFLLPMPNHPHTVLYTVSAFRHPKYGLEKDGFYADPFSQNTSQEPQLSRGSSRHPQHGIPHDGRIFSAGD